MLISLGLGNDYDIIPVGLSNDSNTDMSWSKSRSMSFQADKLCQNIKQTNVWKRLTNCDRIILIGCSQGSLLLRGLFMGRLFEPFIGKTR